MIIVIKVVVVIISLSSLSWIATGPPAKQFEVIRSHLKPVGCTNNREGSAAQGIYLWMVKSGRGQRLCQILPLGPLEQGSRAKPGGSVKRKAMSITCIISFWRERFWARFWVWLWYSLGLVSLWDCPVDAGDAGDAGDVAGICNPHGVLLQP